MGNILSAIRLRGGIGVLCAGAMVGAVGVSSVSVVEAASWVAPAADEHITAGWVQAVARELERDRTHQQGGTKSEGRDSQEESLSYRDRSGSRDQRPHSRDEQERGERGGTARYYTDDFYYPDAGNTPSRSGDRYREATDPRIYRDRAQHQRGRDRFYQEDTGTYDGEQTREDRVYTD